MSKIKPSHLALTITTTITLFAIYYSHSQQISEKRTMREGVERDKARMRRKKVLEEGKNADGARWGQIWSVFYHFHLAWKLWYILYGGYARLEHRRLWRYDQNILTKRRASFYPPSSYTSIQDSILKATPQRNDITSTQRTVITFTQI